MQLPNAIFSMAVYDTYYDFHGRFHCPQDITRKRHSYIKYELKKDRVGVHKQTASADQI